VSRLKATYNKNTTAYLEDHELYQWITSDLQYLTEPGLVRELYDFKPVPPASRATAAALVSEQQELSSIFGRVHQSAYRLAKVSGRPTHTAVAGSLIKHGLRMLAELMDGATLRELERMERPQPLPVVQAGRRRGSHKRLRGLLKPVWVNVSKAALELGVQRSTILKWYKEGQVVVPEEGGTKTFNLQRLPDGRVNLTLLQYIAELKRALPQPGRRLGGGGGTRGLVTAAIRAHGSIREAKDYARTCKALSLLSRVKNSRLLHAARSNLNRLISKRRRA
jgi:hypothetical protein